MRIHASGKSRMVFLFVSAALIQAVFSTGFAAGEKSLRMDPVRESPQTTDGKRGFCIPGSHRLRKQENALRERLKANPGARPAFRSMTPAAWNFQVGQKKTWWATNIDPESGQYDTEYEVESTCRAVGEDCYVFVEDSLWEDGNSGRVTQTAVDSIALIFSNETPADNQKGIYDLVVGHFGSPPNVDGDPKIVILILNIIDGYDGGGYLGGYFYSVNQFPDGSSLIGSHRSNDAEIYYIDANPVDLRTAAGLRDAMSTTSHEFQHMVHWNYDSDESTFVDEGCATLAEIICGFPIYEQSGYAGETNISLFTWRTPDDPDVYNDYSRAARWTLYLYEQFPEGLIRDMVQSRERKHRGINDALISYRPKTGRRFWDVFSDWITANYANDLSAGSQYGYTYFPMIRVLPSRTHLNPNVNSGTRSVSALGAEYIRFSQGSHLSITFISQSNKLIVKSLKTGSSTIEDVPLNSPYTVPGFGSAWPEVTFAVIDTSITRDAVYSYQSTGDESDLIELAYDDGNADGYLNLSAGDTIAVVFDGLSGSTIDSVRIAFRRQGTIRIGVNAYTGDLRPTPSGAVLLPPLNVTCPTATTAYPYPEPYRNWLTVDLSGRHVKSDSDFIIWGRIENPDAPGVMISSEPDTDFRRSMTYLQAEQDWYYLTSGQDSIHKYMIRAYLKTDGMSGFVEDNSAGPEHARLMHGYPNPFNAEATIRYRISENSPVLLQVFNTQGQLVTTLENAFKTAGEYEVRLNGSQLPTGVYVCRLTASGISESQKIMLLK